MKTFGILFAIAFAGFPLLAQEIIPGCEGEGCGCYQSYRNARKRKQRADFEIETIRPFTLYKKMNVESKMIGRFKPGIKARPLGQLMLVENKGEYIIKSVKNGNLSLKVGDKLQLLIYEGEGFDRAQHDGKWISFSELDDLELQTIRQTKLSNWTHIQVDKLTGFTKESPFELCLE